MHANHYNLDYLKQVFQGNDAMVLRILDIFEEEVPKYFAEMSRLGNADLWGELHPLAHKAKSSIGMLGNVNIDRRPLQRKLNRLCV